MSDSISIAAEYSALDSAESVHFGGCGCSGCMAARDDLERSTQSSSGSNISAASVSTLEEMADYLQYGFWNSSVGRSHNLGTTGYDPNNGVLLYNVTGHNSDANGVTAARAELVRDAFDIFEATLGIDFQETTDTNTNSVDFFFSDNNSGAYASSPSLGGIIRYSNINVASSWSGGTSTYDDYTLQTIMHEIGHALGLGHQGNYNGSARYDTDAIYELDSWQATMMSYFSQNENSAISASYEFLQTPMAVDWIALDAIYGQYGYGTDNAFTGDTIYGFNTNIAASESRIWNEFSTYARRTASTIVDGDGIDTLDFSGYSQDQKIDLTVQTADQTFQNTSNIGGRTGNLTLAIGTIIENAVGGSGDDELIGNNADNVLRGGAGNDTFRGFLGDDAFYGDSGQDTVIFDNSFNSYAFNLLDAAIEVIGEGIDYVFETVEYLQFSDALYTFANLFQITDNTKPVTSNDYRRINEGDSVTVAVLNNDSDPDGDEISIVSINGQSITSGGTVTLASGARVTLNADDRLTFDQNGAYRSLDAGETAVEQVNYTVSDGRSQTDATLSVTIDGNSAPDANSDAFQIRIGTQTSLNVLANDRDDEDETLTLVAINGIGVSTGDSVGLPSGARLTVTANGTLRYDQLGVFLNLRPGEQSQETFSYTITDGLDTTTTTAQITVAGNFNPNAQNDSYLIQKGKDASFNVLANDTDLDNDAIVISRVNGTAISDGSSVTLSSGARVTLNQEGKLTYQQNGAFDDLGLFEVEDDSFIYSASDGLGEGAAQVTIRIEGDPVPFVDQSWYTATKSADALTAQQVGNTRIFGDDGRDKIVGSDGSVSDTLHGGSGRDWLWGQGGDDILLGEQGADRLFGEGGNDTLLGGAGNDRMYGGSGADRFVFEDGSGRDKIYDFESGRDTIVLDGMEYKTFDEVMPNMSQNGSSVIIQLSQNDQIKLINTDIGEFSTDSFIFV